MKPVRLPASATIALPRWSIFALCFLYLLPGLIGRDPWKGSDAASFGIMWTMAHGTWQDWLWPHIVGLTMPEEGPLAFWLGALCIKIFGPLMGDPMAARISTGLAFMLASGSVWYTTYLLGRRTEAQPLKLAFGGQPEPKDFGRTLADGALLIFLGCWGLLVPSHQTSASSLHLALFSYSIYLSVRLFDQSKKRYATQLGLCLGLMILSKGWILPLALFASLILLSIYRRQPVWKYLLSLSLPATILVSLIWILSAQALLPFNSSPIPAWHDWNLKQIAAPTWEHIKYFFRYSIWYAWPAWPFAGWAIYQWRKQERALHISVPVGILVCVTLLALLNPNHEETLLLPLLPPMAILAAFGLPTMKRSAINAVDWFAVMILTGAAGLAWFGAITMQTGWPTKTAHKILSWAPGYQAEFNLFLFLIAGAVTIVWFRLVYWRISRQPSVLWRAVVLSNGGVILCWFLLMTLWLPLINHRVSYAVVTEQLKQNLPTNYRCIDSNLGPSQRASFAYFGKLHFANFSEQECELLLIQSKRSAEKDSINAQEKRYPGKWKIIWQGHRASDKDEYFSLFEKQNKSKPN